MALSPQEKQRLKDIARELRLTVIDVMAWSGGAHVGGSLSIIDILTILYCFSDQIALEAALERAAGQLEQYAGAQGVQRWVVTA